MCRYNHPPVGNVLFVGARVAGLRIEPVISKLVPFLIAIIGGLFLVVFIPELSLWLPRQLDLIAPQEDQAPPIAL